VNAHNLGSQGGDGKDEPTDQHSSVATALDAIPVEDMSHVQWIIIGMSLHNETEGSDVGLSLFDKFSRRSSKYDRDGLEAQWRSFAKKPPGRSLRTARTIFYHAQQYGWRAPQPEDDPGYIKALEDEARRHAIGACTHVWQGRDIEIPCTPLGDEQKAPDGRTYVRIRRCDGVDSYAPKDELFTNDEIGRHKSPPPPIPAAGGDGGSGSGTGGSGPPRPPTEGPPGPPPSPLDPSHSRSRDLSSGSSSK
jgi:hypothetical protein